jgi:Sigma-70, region 4
LPQQECPEDQIMEESAMEKKTGVCRYCEQQIVYSAPKDEFLGVLENEGISQLSRWRHAKNGRVPCDLYAEPIYNKVGKKKTLVKKGRPRMTVEEMADRNAAIVRDYDKGCTLKEIAVHYQISQKRIKQILEKDYENNQPMTVDELVASLPQEMENSSTERR